MLIGIDCHCLEGHRTGEGRYLFSLLKEWSKFNLKTRNPLLKTNLRFILYFKNEIPKDIPRSEIFERKKLGVGSNFLFEQLHLALAAKRDQIDLLFCPSYQQPIFYRGKVALTIHDIIYRVHPEWYNWQSAFEKVIFQYIFRRSAQKADLIFVPSDFTKKEIIKYYGVNEQKIKVTPYGVDESFRMLEKQDKRLREVKEKYAVGERCVLYIGSIFERRFLPQIISAFKELDEPGLQFFIVGRDCTKKNIDGIIEQANQQIGERAINRIVYVDEQDLVYLYNSAKAFIWLSSYEGFGFPPLEAMACGVPVITTKTTSLAEVVGDSAVIVKDPSNVSEIKKALKDVLTNDQLRNGLNKSSPLQAQKFSWERCAGETKDGIAQLL